MEISARSENLLTMIRVGAAGGDGSAPGTNPDIKKSDVLAALGCLKANEYLALDLFSSLTGDACVRIELQIEIRKHLYKFAWFDEKKMQSSDYRAKLSRVIGYAIDELSGGKPVPKIRKADSLLIRPKSYYENWVKKESDILSMLKQWASDGDRALKYGLSEPSSFFA